MAKTAPSTNIQANIQNYLARSRKRSSFFAGIAQSTLFLPFGIFFLFLLTFLYPMGSFGLLGAILVFLLIPFSYAFIQSWRRSHLWLEKLLRLKTLDEKSQADGALLTFVQEKAGIFGPLIEEKLVQKLQPEVINSSLPTLENKVWLRFTCLLSFACILIFTLPLLENTPLSQDQATSRSSLSAQTKSEEGNKKEQKTRNTPENNSKSRDNQASKKDAQPKGPEPTGKKNAPNQKESGEGEGIGDKPTQDLSNQKKTPGQIKNNSGQEGENQAENLRQKNADLDALEASQPSRPWERLAEIEQHQKSLTDKPEKSPYQSRPERGLSRQKRLGLEAKEEQAEEYQTKQETLRLPADKDGEKKWLEIVKKLYRPQGFKKLKNKDTLPAGVAALPTEKPPIPVRKMLGSTQLSEAELRWFRSWFERE